MIGLTAGDALSDEATVKRSFGSPEEIGRLFLTDHLLAFEITSIVLLVAAVGGVVLGTRSRAEDEEERGACRGLTSPGTWSSRRSSSRSAPPACSCAAAR